MTARLWCLLLGHIWTDLRWTGEVRQLRRCARCEKRRGAHQ